MVALCYVGMAAIGGLLKLDRGTDNMQDAVCPCWLASEYQSQPSTKGQDVRLT